MAEIIMRITVPDEEFKPESYPDLKNPSVADMIDFEIKSWDNSEIGDGEFLENMLLMNGILEIEHNE
jgi:hypothetical protein